MAAAPRTLASTASNNSRVLLQIIVLSALASVAVLGVLAFRYPTAQIPPHVLSFRFNPYVFLSLLGILCNGFLLVYVNLPKLRTPEAPWYSLYLTMNVIWGVGEAVARLSATPAGAIFWWHFEAVGLGFAPCAFFLFALAYTYQDSFVRYVTPVIAMATLGLLIVYLFLATGVLVDKNPAHARLTPWGYYPAYPHTYYPFLVWLLAGYAGAQVLLIARFRRTRDWHKVKLFVIGALVPLIIGLVTDAILPAFGAFFPPSAVVATAIFAAIVAYVMARYGLLRLNPRTFAPGILQTMSEGVLVTDPELQIEFSNTGALSLLAAQESSLLEKKDLRDLFSAVEKAALQQYVVAPLAKQPVTHYDDAHILSLENQDIPVSISATKVLDSQNRLTGYSFVLTDLRQIKAAERQLEIEKESVERKVKQRTLELSQAHAELEASISSLPFGFAIINADDEIAFSNGKLGALLGHEVPADLPGSKRVLKQIDAEFQSSIKLLDCIHEAQAAAKPLEKNISLGPRFFRFFFMPVLGHGVEGGRAIGGVLLVEDTTEAKAAERSRDEFFSIASHELRTPLTAIRGNSDTILRFYPEPLKDESLRQMVDDIHGSSVRLINIVNSFLDMSRLEQGKLVFQIQPFDIAELISGLLHEYEAAAKPGLTFTFESPAQKLPPVMADEERTRQVLTNLLANAIKYTSVGGITITAVLIEKMVKISVTDTGEGIPVASQHLLFRKFQQASNNILTRDNTQSTGLGLYVSKLLVDNMGGRIYVERTEEGKGSTFTLELPCADQTASAGQRPPADKSLDA